jgi:hypothetical protein
MRIAGVEQIMDIGKNRETGGYGITVVRGDRHHTIMSFHG